MIYVGTATWTEPDTRERREEWFLTTEYDFQTSFGGKLDQAIEEANGVTVVLVTGFDTYEEAEDWLEAEGHWSYDNG